MKYQSTDLKYFSEAMKVHNKLTIIMPTHFIPSAPSTEIIEQAIKSLSTLPDLEGCKLHINYDMPEEQSEDHKKYYHNLVNIEAPNKIVTFIPGAQQRTSFMFLLRAVSTPYVMLIEHDWVFIEKPPIAKVIKAMDNHPNINAVYFNKRSNVRCNNEPYLIPDTTIQEVPLLKTSKWSNNPSITRISKWCGWLDMLDSAPIDRSRARKQIEPCLHGAYQLQVEKEGFEVAHKDWGCYSYGRLGKNKMIKYLNGSKHLNKE